MRKVFDCQDMPDDVRRAFFESTYAGNDCYVNYWIAEVPEEDYREDPTKKLVDDWLKQFPLSPSEMAGDDPVIIKHWW